MTEVDLSKIADTAAEAVIVLWNHIPTLPGPGSIHSSKSPTEEGVEDALKFDNYIDYLNGRPFKTDFGSFPLVSSRGFDNVHNEVGALKKLVTNIENGSAMKYPPTRQLSEAEILRRWG